MNKTLIEDDFKDLEQHMQITFHPALSHDFFLNHYQQNPSD